MLKRDKIKYIRDKIKSNYKARDKCYICGTVNELELHHIYSLAELFKVWCKNNDIEIEDITTVSQINKARVEFQEDCKDQLSNNNMYTLCKDHHKKLHNIYGQSYHNIIAKKIEKWLEIQREKYGME